MEFIRNRMETDRKDVGIRDQNKEW